MRHEFFPNLRKAAPHQAHLCFPKLGEILSYFPSFRKGYFFHFVKKSPTISIRWGLGATKKVTKTLGPVEASNKDIS